MDSFVGPEACGQLITICMTMGRRPAHLRATLESLGDVLRKIPIIAINDFGDEETNLVFKKFCPQGQLIDLGRRMGHHPAVDAMYEKVETPFIMHIEDDWNFTRQDFLDDALRLLAADSRISSVCLREISDFTIDEKHVPLISREERGGISFARLDALHEQWHGYTFNPHIARKSLWIELGKFSQFKKERHISRVLRAKGRFTAFLEPGVCHHIGGDFSVSQPDPSLFKKIKTWIRGRS